MEWTGTQSTERAARRRCKHTNYNPAQHDMRRRSIDGLDALENDVEFQIMCQEFGSGDGASERKTKRRPSNTSLSSIPIDELFDEIKASKCITSAAAVQLYARQPNYADDDSSTESENSAVEERQARRSSLDNLKSGIDTIFKAPPQTQNLWGVVRREKRSSIGSQKSHDRTHIRQREVSKQRKNTKNGGFWRNIMESLGEEQVVEIDSKNRNHSEQVKRQIPFDSNTISTIATPQGKQNDENDHFRFSWGGRKDADENGKMKVRMSHKTVSTIANSSTDQMGGSRYGGSEVPRSVSRAPPLLDPLKERMEAKRIIDSVPSEIFLTTNENLTTEKAPDIPGSQVEYNMFDVEFGSNIACEIETDSVSHFSS